MLNCLNCVPTSAGEAAFYFIQSENVFGKLITNQITNCKYSKSPNMKSLKRNKNIFMKKMFCTYLVQNLSFNDNFLKQLFLHSK
jgi:hypothetical protein